MTVLVVWAERVRTLADRVEATWPGEDVDTLDRIRLDTGEIVHHLPLAERHHDPGDGLRSPSLEGGSASKGTHADPVLRTVEAHLPTYDPDSKRPADKLRVAESQRWNAVTWLKRASETEDPLIRSRRLREAASQLSSALSTLHALQPPPNPPQDARTRTGDPGCRSCARVPKSVTDKRPWWVPTYVGERGRSTLCHWCERRTAAARSEWVEAHPGEQPPDDKRFWPPRRAVEWRRDEGDRRISPERWDGWVAEDKRARKGKTKRRKKAA